MAQYALKALGKICDQVILDKAHSNRKLYIPQDL